MLECLCMCTHESERSELLNVSVLAWLYSCIYATSICISAYVGGGEKHSLTKNICLCMQMQCILLSSLHFVG